MQDILEFQNPIAHLKAKLPAMVWEYWCAKVISEINRTQKTTARKNSFRTSFVNYSKGERGMNAMYRFHAHLREIINEVWEIKNEGFYFGDAAGMLAAAEETRLSLLERFEKTLEEQKKMVA